jgi:transposase-like protein
VRLVFQAALEAEVTEFLGRDRYAHRAHATGVAQRLHRGHGQDHGWPGRTRAAQAAAPTRRSPQGCWANMSVTPTRLQALAISGWVRGLSDRDVEAALAEALGPQAAPSKSTVSRICEQVKHECTAWKGDSPVQARTVRWSGASDFSAATGSGERHRIIGPWSTSALCDRCSATASPLDWPRLRP